MAYLLAASYTVTTSTREAAPNHEACTQPIPTTIPRSPSTRDPFYGHEPVSRLCGRYITHLFECPKYPPSSTTLRVTLPLFIAYALHRTKLDPSVTYAALVLITRLKCRYPSSQGISGHRLFLVAFMLAAKQMCDDTYSNKSWTIVGQGVFSLSELNRMEREMCGIVKWQLNVCNSVLRNFEVALKRDFYEGKAGYPTYSSSLMSRLSIEPARGMSSSGRFSSFQKASDGMRNLEASRDAPTMEVGYMNDHGSESPGDSLSSSPASSASPATPVGDLNYGARIEGVDSSPLFALADDSRASANRPLKNQTYSFVIPGVW